MTNRAVQRLLNPTLHRAQRNKLEQMASLEKRSVSNLIEVMADERWERLVEQQGIAHAKTVAQAMNLKTRHGQCSRPREIAPGSSRSCRREKNAKAKRCFPQFVDCYFHHRMNFPRSVFPPRKKAARSLAKPCSLIGDYPMPVDRHH